MNTYSESVSSKIEKVGRKKDARIRVSQALVLLLLGVFLGCVTLEVFLWIAGRYYVSRYVGMIEVIQKDLKRIRIVALGESTTAPLSGPAWPEFLEQELNMRAGYDAYRVYNLGVSGSNSSAIYRRLVTEAMMLDPDMVITMMGVNDIKYLALPTSLPSWWSRMGDRIQATRSYKLFAIMGRLLSGQRKQLLTQTALTCHADEMGDNAWSTLSLPAYEAIIQKSYPDRYVGQYSNGPQDQAAEQILKEFLLRFPFSYQAYEVLVDHYVSRSMWSEVVTWASAYRDMQDLIHACVMANPTITAQSKDIIVRHVEDIGVFMDSLLGIAHQMVNEKTGKDLAYYEAIKAQVGAWGKPSNFNTAEIYRKIHTLLKQRGVRYVAMQYPLLSVRTIQDMFPADSTVTFVSNELNFQNAIKDMSYGDLFVDNFAGVFGHTTELGSRLIASSAADAVMSILPSKK
ncbi:SGNH/GDSL hydrolase family protein [Candidatus Woesebacteria bacterium]|nr:SGNH/GDSL hydrolase family protein [Candidatus Woesebacteria bacterium]